MITWYPMELVRVIIVGIIMGKLCLQRLLVELVKAMLKKYDLSMVIYVTCNGRCSPKIWMNVEKKVIYQNYLIKVQACNDLKKILMKMHKNFATYSKMLRSLCMKGARILASCQPLCIRIT
ncbi:hypothetical protein ACSBR1_034024 [Camellia fascicularis]